MKQLLFLVFLISLLPGKVVAQLTKGRIVYERTTKMLIKINDQAFQNPLPQERKDKFELLYADNKSLWRPLDDDSPEPETHMENGGAEIKIMVPGTNDVTYTDFQQQRKVEKRELFTKEFVIEDSVRKLKWKLGNDSKKILGFDCKMASSQRIQPSMRVTMDNGETKREEVMDTATIVAWYTDAVPGFGGPEIYQGQLPGTILEVDINNGRSHFIALEISPKVDIKEIKEPKGKKMTPKEFAKERDKMFEEMQKNNGGNFNIKVGN